MKDFHGKVAVVTGAASGIGRALAEKSAQEGMKVVLADFEVEALKKAEEELKAGGADVLAVHTDVSQAGDVENLAQQSFATYGAVHLLFNNAGVGAGTTVCESTLADWQWVLGVNLWGVIYGIHFFVPRMLAQNTEGHIINTASSAGLMAGPGLGIYKVTKHGVVSLSETLAHELRLKEAKLKASVLCPWWVNTNIAESERNRPASLQNPAVETPVDPETQAQIQAVQQMVRHAIQTGMAPSQVAELTFDAIRQGKFYILTDPIIKQSVQLRMDDILQDRYPTNVMLLSEQ